MRYLGQVIRPPSEADSLILQVMYGCSHGECAFCGSYLGKPFRIRPFAEVRDDVLRLPADVRDAIGKVFLCDGDALSIPSRRMVEVLDLLAAELPHLSRVSAYANAHSLLRIPEEELREIRAHGLELLYVGLESGDEATLAHTGKGVTAAEQIEAFRKAKRAGFRLSVTAILGLAGVLRSFAHARGTGEALSAIDPDYIGILTLMLEPGTQLYDEARRGDFVVPGPPQLLLELREMIDATDVTYAVFRTNHASNYLSLRGTLPEDKAGLLRLLDDVLAAPDRARLKPEHLRGL
jgi:radical SAM superfamily enzyme YgiQ (UPF0313 family)